MRLFSVMPALTLKGRTFHGLPGYGGSLVYDYGFNVETAVDSPVWHPNERDLFPGQNAPADTTPALPATGDPSRSEG